MAKFVSNRDESVRLFANPVLEYFTHIHPITPVIVFAPPALYLLVRACLDLGWMLSAVIALAGVLVWTIFEYSLHRWAFHYEPKTAAGKRVHFWVHGIHHDYPRDHTRLVMPLLVSLPLAIAFFALFRLSFGQYGLPLFSGFMIGYIAYDSIHYATHHFPMRSGWAKFLKEYHLRHHYNDEQSAYGVSNPLWDYILGTVPPHLHEKNDAIPSEDAVSEHYHKS